MAEPSKNDDVPSTSPNGLLKKPRRRESWTLNAHEKAVKEYKSGQAFHKKASAYRRKSVSEAVREKGNSAASLTTLFVGISAVASDSDSAVVAIAIHDSIYLIDFSVKHIPINDKNPGKVISDYIIEQLKEYEHKYYCKFIGAGIPFALAQESPNLCSRLWAQMDILPVALRTSKPKKATLDGKDEKYWEIKCVDEQADSMARKCIMFFGPKMTPILQVGFEGVVQVDAGFRSIMCTLEDYRSTCEETTWTAVMKYANELKDKKTKIAFFSSTPQGGGVALMRHALVRFAKVLGVDLKWYVPKPKPGVFRVTKNVHNTLQGVSKPGERIPPPAKDMLTEWIDDNAHRYWLSDDGPLSRPSDGGADVIIIDDPQMPGLIPMIKKLTPDRPVLFRSHIQIRSDLADEEGTPQSDIWQFLWDKIQYADMFISHPVPVFVPKNVPKSKVAYLPATTDWLDGLNKPMSDWDMGYYAHEYNTQCTAANMTPLEYPARKYIIQIARFDPAKGIPDVVASYVEFRRRLQDQGADDDAPQLLIVGNSSVDDPDGALIFDETMKDLEVNYSDLMSSISIMRLDANDQLLNTLITNAHVVLQLSTREGFEVKVSEALHKGRPVIATNTGGIPLQMQHGKNGFVVEPGDSQTVATHLMELWTDEALYTKMSEYASNSVSDEVGTVGNALAWFYLAAVWARGDGVVPNERWVNDLAREEAGVPYQEGENRISRKGTEKAAHRA
ncbi:MAG: hypothetical protein M1818_008048 [Claussenomyces sp. TS43310]|nr:MAG: hypothetical protein M1818_008048 [Claussenomyces sp. TS43310]